ncbi:MAG: phosphate ABC transporter substrate-binding protein [Candidatus Saliniplasma sp.]
MKMQKKSKMMVFGLVGILLVASVLMAGCTEEDDEVNEVTATGSSTVLPIAETAAEEFNNEHDDIQVSVSGGGSGYGINAIIEGTADIGMASRDIKQSEIDKVPDVVENTVARDGLAIIVSKTVYDEGIQDLTQQQVIDIYSGDITNWDELGGPDEDIYVVERADTSGTYGTFMDLLGLDETEAQSTEQENADVKSTVGNTDYGIGYVGMGYVGDDTPAVALDGVELTRENVAEGDYPLQRGLHMYTNGEPTGAVKEYIDFIMSDRGQEIVEEIGFIPLNA